MTGFRAPFWDGASESGHRESFSGRRYQTPGRWANLRRTGRVPAFPPARTAVPPAPRTHRSRHHWPCSAEPPSPSQPGDAFSGPDSCMRSETRLGAPPSRPAVLAPEVTPVPRPTLRRFAHVVRFPRVQAPHRGGQGPPAGGVPRALVGQGAGPAQQPPLGLLPAARGGHPLVRHRSGPGALVLLRRLQHRRGRPAAARAPARRQLHGRAPGRGGDGRHGAGPRGPAPQASRRRA